MLLRIHSANSTESHPSVSLGLNHDLENVTEVNTRTEQFDIKASVKHSSHVSYPLATPWEYSIISNADESFSAFILLECKNSSMKLLKKQLRNFNGYPVTLYVRFSVSIDNQIWYDFGLLRVVRSPLHVVISGPSSAVRGSGLVLLSGAGSFDPETGSKEGLRFSWYCIRRRQSCTPADIMSGQGTKILQIDTKKLQANSNYTFRLEVTDQRGSAKNTTDHNLEVQPALYLR